MAPKRGANNEGDVPVPTTETNPEDPPKEESTSNITEEQWEAMDAMLKNVYAYRLEDGYDPTKLFHRMINRKLLPGYYDVIKEPMALSVIKTNLRQRTFKEFSHFVRDFALIPHNAQVYNVTESQAYQDALVLKDAIEKELKSMVERKLIEESDAELPYLGEIPDPDEDVAEGEDEAEEDAEDDEDDEEEEADDSDEEGGRRKRKRPGRPSLAKRESARDVKDDKSADARKRRGRPPRVDTPIEARIKAVMKGIRKPKNSSNQPKISHFEKLPDKAVMPEYYDEIKDPMSMDLLKRRLKRKYYSTVDKFMVDVETMFNNAKQYNLDDSQIYKDAVDLQKEARELAAQEKAKPDTEFVMEDGRLPMPDGILNNGELWKAGDWVHIQNPNDLTKPIIAQIFRTWQDGDGTKWVNACWYYRPEQTVHRFDRHFFEHEVVKTGQYRDHRIDEIVDRCFVMFITRFNKGRPRGFPPDKEVYVCEARYNEEKHKLNKIKTWASCVPDEVRERDYEMDLFEVPKKMKKMPSPIAHLLKDDAKEDDEIPSPEWGAENAPPKVGAVHKRPRDPKDSPPPEPTPTPPPQPPPPPPRQPASQQTATMNFSQNGVPQTGQGPVPSPQPTQTQQQQAWAQQRSFQHHSASPAAPHHPSQYQQMQHAPMTPSQSSFNTGHGHHPQHAHHTQFQNYQSPASAATHSQHMPRQSYAVQPTPAHQQPYNPQAQARLSHEVFVLPDMANSSIPREIRDRFQTDDAGRVLFFTAPPRETQAEDPAGLQHSARYLAAKIKRAELLKEKEKQTQEKRSTSRGVNGTANSSSSKGGSSEQDLSNELNRREEHALQQLNNELGDDLAQLYIQRFGENALEEGLKENERLNRSWREHESKRKRQAEDETNRKRTQHQTLFRS